MTEREAEAPAEEEASRPRQKSGPPIVSLLAIGLSICALLVSVFEVSAIRDEVRFQVWPFVSVGTGYSSEGFQVRLENKGVGPAKIRAIEYSWDGQPVQAERRSDVLNELVRRAVGDEEAFDYGFYRMSDPEGGVMSADESTSLFAVPWTDTTRVLADRWGRSLFVTVCYCSVYEDCWVAELNGGEPASVPSCPDGG